MNNLRNRHYQILFVVSLLLDLWSKHFMSGWLRFGQSKEVISGFFSFTLVHNRGAAFSIGSNWSTPVFLGFSVIALAAVIYTFHQLKPQEKLSGYGLSMILGGAVGNIFDRIRLGYVVDFLDVYVRNHHWPVFNVADSLITVGAVFLAWDMLRSSKSH